MSQQRADTGTLVAVHGAGLAYGAHSVLDDVSLTLEPGRITTLIGPNGAGKSTLARLVLGLARPDRGRVERRPGLRVGYMPQHLQVDESLPLTVDRFLWLAAPGRTRARRDALQRTGVAHLRRRAVRGLSGGEMQRVLLARALLRKPDLLVLDDRHLLSKLAERGCHPGKATHEHSIDLLLQKSLGHRTLAIQRIFGGGHQQRPLQWKQPIVDGLNDL